MKVSRRGFLKISGAVAAGMAVGSMGFDLQPVKVHAQMLKTRYAKETTTICCYCGVGCGALVHTSKKGDGRIINIEGDPDHVINRGALCSKGAALKGLAENTNRLLNPMYRAPFSDKWEEVSWDWAIDRIAQRVKKIRDASFVKRNAAGQVVNRTEAIASVGSAAFDNEECWIYQALMRALGLVYIEHQARLCHSSTVAALAESFGRGAMTNHFIDMKNSDCILVMGSNAAETHPISFKWVTEAQRKGATLISVDPRFTRTSAKADIYAPLRSGTDVAFLGGMIRYILENGLYHKDYVLHYTNATLLLNPEYRFEKGLFAGFDPKTRKYDQSKWAFQLDAEGKPKRDMSLKDPLCVFNQLKKHYSRYDLKTVSSVTGTSEADLLAVYKAFTATGKPDNAGTILYAMGWTQHTIGVQIIRTMTIVQLLLGNIGMAGGGVNALRGESNVQGSTDHALLYHIWPGYLGTPTAKAQKLADILSRRPKSKDPLSLNWWQNEPKYIVSFLKAMFGDQATAENEFGYPWMPKLEDGKAYSWLDLFDEMYKGSIKGLFAWGMNPACSGANSNKTRKALANLEWLVNVNLFDNETGSFWKGPGMKPGDIGTEVFMLPACVSVEKEGSITNSGRWMQWRYAGPNPLGNSRPDGDIILELGLKLKEIYQKEGGVFPDPILNLKWDYMSQGKYDPHKVAKIINGTFTRDVKIGEKEFKAGKQVPSFAFLQADGSTACGNWIYSGSYTDAGNMAARRKTNDAVNQIGLYPEFAWAWPVNRRILYNRASVDLKGQPFDAKRWVMKWEGDKWIGDIPDGPAPPLADAQGNPNPNGKHPFIMTLHGFGQLFGPGLKDGPFPEHYEAMECPIEKNPLSDQLHSPTVPMYASAADQFAATCDPKYPYVCSTYRVSEHWQTGLMTRPQPWLLELQPQVFVEMSEELAKLKNIQNGERVIVSTVRGSLEATAIVTKRFRPMKIAGTLVYPIGLPYNYGWRWPASGTEESANLLTASTGDSNTRIPETKTFMANVSKK